jgi:hypothetical protein
MHANTTPSRCLYVWKAHDVKDDHGRPNRSDPGNLCARKNVTLQMGIVVSAWRALVLLPLFIRTALTLRFGDDSFD